MFCTWMRARRELIRRAARNASRRCGYIQPKTTRTFICEFHLGTEEINRSLGSSMHVFLLNVPRLEFAALIPKGEYVTLVLLGTDTDKALVDSFLGAPEVRRCFPTSWKMPEDYCRCFPSINILGSRHPLADRLVFIGDCGENRLYKDGIGGAYRTAKAAAKTAVFEGVSAEDFRRHFLPVCRDLARDNAIGKVIFAVTRLIQSLKFARRGVLRMVRREQAAGGAKPMSGVLWDTFTGSAPYRDVFRRAMHPFCLARLLLHTLAALAGGTLESPAGGKTQTSTELGKRYGPGEVIVRQGEEGHCMYVIQAGRVEVIEQDGEKEVRLAELGEGDFFGDMALFEKDVRSATVRALGEVRVLTVDERILLRKIHEEPSLAFRIIQKMSRRIRGLDKELVQASAVPAGDSLRVLGKEAGRARG